MVNRSDINKITQEGEIPHESAEEFKKRVFVRTGAKFEDIPKGNEQDALLHIFCRHGDVYVVGIDQHPEEDEQGNKIYKEFRVVDLSGSDKYQKSPDEIKDSTQGILKEQEPTPSGMVGFVDFNGFRECNVGFSRDYPNSERRRVFTDRESCLRPYEHIEERAQMKVAELLSDDPGYFGVEIPKGSDVEFIPYRSLGDVEFFKKNPDRLRYYWWSNAYPHDEFASNRFDYLDGFAKMNKMKEKMRVEQSAALMLEAFVPVEYSVYVRSVRGFNRFEANTPASGYKGEIKGRKEYEVFKRRIDKATGDLNNGSNVRIPLSSVMDSRKRIKGMSLPGLLSVRNPDGEMAYHEVELPNFGDIPEVELTPEQEMMEFRLYAESNPLDCRFISKQDWVEGTRFSYPKMNKLGNENLRKIKEACDSAGEKVSFQTGKLPKFRGVINYDGKFEDKKTEIAEMKIRIGETDVFVSINVKIEFIKMKFFTTSGKKAPDLRQCDVSALA